MSDQSGGPGWWQASDGKWYPPEPGGVEAIPVGSKPPWWKRSVPLWSLIVAALVGIALGASSAGTSDDTKSESAANESEATTTTTEAAEATTTTVRRTTTTARPTTTTVAPTPEQVRALAKTAFQSTFDSTRSNVAGVLSSDQNVETLDQFTYDPAADLVTVSVTSAWASPDNQVDGAWEISRAMAVLFERDNGVWWAPEYVPNFRLVNSGTAYDCAADLMVRLGSLEAARDAWEAEC